MDSENELQPMHDLDELEAQDRMTWVEAQHGWVAAPYDVVEALSKDGFDGESHRDHAFSSRERDPYMDDGGES